MNRLLLMATSVLLVSPLDLDRAANRDPDDKKLEEEISELETQRFKAMTENDFASLERILADDLSYSHTSGWLQTKGEFIATLRSGQLKYESISAEETKVRVYGNTGVVTGRASLKVRSKGQEESFRVRYLDVYINRNGRWQMVGWQSTRLVQQ